MGALPDKFTEKGSDGVGCGDDVGEGEIDFASTVSRRSRTLIGAGASGEGFTSASLLDTEGSNDEGDADLGASGLENITSGAARTRGSGTGKLKY